MTIDLSPPVFSSIFSCVALSLSLSLSRPGKRVTDFSLGSDAAHAWSEQFISVRMQTGG